MPIAVFPKVIGLSETLPEDDITACVELKAPTLNVTNEHHIIKQRDNTRACFLFIESQVILYRNPQYKRYSLEVPLLFCSTQIQKQAINQQNHPTLTIDL